MNLFTDPEKFKNIAAGIQSYVLVAAVIFGGCWTFYTFGLLGQVNRARAELKQIERDLAEQASPVPELQITQLSLPNDKGLYVNIEATVVNRGNLKIELRFDDPPLDIFPIQITEEGVTQFGKPMCLFPTSQVADTNILPSKLVTLSAGGEIRFQFMGRVSQPGLYWFNFHIPANPRDFDLDGKIDTLDAGQDEFIVFLETGRFFVVK